MAPKEKVSAGTGKAKTASKPKTDGGPPSSRRASKTKLKSPKNTPSKTENGAAIAEEEAQVSEQKPADVTAEAFSWMSEAFGKAFNAVSAMATGSSEPPQQSYRTQNGDGWMESPDGVGMVRKTSYEKALAEKAAAEEASESVAAVERQNDIDTYIRLIVQNALDRAARQHVGMPVRVVLS